MDRYPYYKYTILLGATRALTHIGVHIYTHHAFGLSDILSKEKKLGDYETMALSEECSAILQKKLPPKLNDQNSFTIPCAIGNSVFEKDLWDLVSSINLMLWLIFKKLKFGEARPTTVTLQLAD